MSTLNPILPTDQNKPLARESSRRLSEFAQGGDLKIRVDGSDTPVTLPAAAVRLLVDMLAQLAQGNAVTLVPFHAELTTQQAADFLGVSRPHVIKLLDNEALPYHRVGTHRRIRFEQLLAYRNEQRQKRHESLSELTELAQREGHGY